MTGVGRLGGRRQGSPKRLLGWVLAAIVLLTGGVTVAFSPMAHGQVGARSAGSAQSGGSDLPGVPIVSPKIVTQPSNGTAGVSPIAPVRVSVTNGVLDKVSLTNPEGKEVAGRFSPDRFSWTTTEPLGYAKTYTWSGSAAEGSPSRGVNPGIEDSYSPSNSSTQVFDMAFLKIDSDQAFAVAQKHGGDKILEKSPDTPVIYICDWNHNTSELTWHVIYGSQREGAKLTVAVNASSAEFIRVEK